jgi:hypothetical protein
MSDTHQPLVEKAQVVLTETREPAPQSFSPTLLFWLVFVVVLLLTLLEWKKSWKMGWLDAVVYGITFLVSVLVIFLWFFTEHYCTKPNFNILWASPLFIYFAIAQQKSNKWVICLQLLMLFAAMVMTIGPLPQRLNMAILPIALILVCRLLSDIKFRNNN